MKKVNYTVIATIIATFAISMFAFQPTAAGASNNTSPSATPSPRKLRKMPRQSIEVENDETHRTRKPGTKVKAKKPTANLGDTATHERRKQQRKASKKTNKGWYSVLEVDDEVVRKRKTTKSSKN